MALNPKFCAAGRNAAIDAGLAVIGASGKFRWYDGTQPTDSDTALGAQVLLADLALSATAFAGASAGSASANSITADSSADATGTCTWCSFTTSADVRKLDGSAGTGTVNLVLNTASIVTGANCSCSSATVTMAA